MDVNINITLQPCDCSCSCPYCNPKPLKRKLDQIPEDEIARVEIETEAAALRETLAKQQESIQSLCAELEEERAAASTAASEAMSMILRLQRDKAEAQMDARQFKLLSEEKMAHDQEQIGVLEDLLFKRDEAVRFLSDELLAYRHRLLSCESGDFKASVVAEKSAIDEGFGSSLLREEFGSGEFRSMGEPSAYAMDAVNGGDVSGRDSAVDFKASIVAEKSVIDEGFGSSSLQEEFGGGEFRSMGEPSAYAMDAVNVGDVSGRDSAVDFEASVVTEKGVIENGGSVRGISDESFGSPSLQEEFGGGEFRSMGDCSSCAMDAVNGAGVSVQRGFLSRGDYGNGNVEEGEIKRLYRRLQALEADRESMREAIVTMGTDKAQRILLKEIARKLHKEAMPEKRIVKKAWFLRSFSVISAFKWMASLFFWRKKSPRIKYPIGLSNQKAGLLLLLDSSQRKRLRRCLTRLPR